MFIQHVTQVPRDDQGAYERRYPFQALQLTELKGYPATPFRIDRAFRVAFRKAVLEYGEEKIMGLASQ